MDSALVVIYGLILCWGAAWGSFLNVVIWRLPNEMSVVSPPSHCPKCQRNLAWWHNVPVFGWAWLGGKCHYCKVAISARYPAVEATTAALTLAVSIPWVSAWLIGDLMPWQAGVGLLAEHLLIFACVAIALIDADTFMIPDRLSLPLVPLGIVVAVLIGEHRGVSWQEASLASFVAGGGLLAVQWGYAAMTGREGLGTGDVKLLAALGAWLGLQTLPPLLLLASVQGLLFAFGTSFFGKTNLKEERGLESLRHLALPFGPFLVLAGLQTLLLRSYLEPLIRTWLGG
ncbi:MAG TPA: prepilin peptidase [Myxococcales bacterium]|nr:prepilin peptidase [Myxococcales bacterium]HAN32794.1 prepilin peptidase [Myxococcales bacterium]